MYFEGKADAGDFGPRIAKVNKTGRPDGRRLFGNGSISYGGVKKDLLVKTGAETPQKQENATL